MSSISHELQLFEIGWVSSSFTLTYRTVIHDLPLIKKQLFRNFIVLSTEHYGMMTKNSNTAASNSVPMAKPGLP